ncbi:helix-turn-helix domain-containing protein [Rothia koreensis]|uniref:helix-turn-helix domain-containing protein n=1 Tax=Rothia koreensis TaxID=592378 RepID=UPI003FCDAFCB
MRAEVRKELEHRGMTSFNLSKLVDRSRNYLNERISQANKELTLNDVEMICQALGVNINDLMGRATQAYEDEVLKLSVARHTNLEQDGYCLAAQEKQDDVPEE